MWEMSSISSSRSRIRTQLSSEAQTLLLISASHFSKKELSSSHAGWTFRKGKFVEIRKISINTMRKRTEMNSPMIVDHLDLPLHIKEMS